MEDFKVVILIMAILIGITAIANKRKLPFPVLLVFAGLLIGFIPQMPSLALGSGCCIPHHAATAFV